MREFVVDVWAAVTLRIQADSEEEARKLVDEWHQCGVTLADDYTELSEDGHELMSGTVTLYTKAVEHEEYRLDAPVLIDEGPICPDCTAELSKDGAACSACADAS